jgi:pyrimidine-nucleoside phosphorylase
LQDGSAWGKFIAMVEAQGGDASALSKMGEIHRAPTIIEVAAPFDGTLTRLDALEIGRLSTELGAGRGKTDDKIDFAVGVECLRKQGEKVSAGDPILRIHSRVTVDGGGIADRAITVS